ETIADLVRIGQRIARAARRSGLHADGNNVVINDGKAAFQSVFHIHLHVLPRQNRDKQSFAKGMLLRKDTDREESGRLLRIAPSATGRGSTRLTPWTSTSPAT